MDKGVDALLEPFLPLCDIPVDEMLFPALDLVVPEQEAIFVKT